MQGRRNQRDGWAPDGLLVPTLHELGVDQWYLAEEGGLLFDDVGPFRNFGDIVTTNARKARGSRTEGRYGPTEIARHRLQVLRWTEDGGWAWDPAEH